MLSYYGLLSRLSSRRLVCGENRFHHVATVPLFNVGRNPSIPFRSGALSLKLCSEVLVAVPCVCLSSLSHLQDLPPISNLQPVAWPNLIKSARNWILAKFIIQRRLDPEFNLTDFCRGARHAICKVSELVSKGQFVNLHGLMTQEAIQETESKVGNFSLAQRSALYICNEDICFSFPYEVGMIILDPGDNDGNNTGRPQYIVEILMVCHVIRGLKTFRSGEITKAEYVRRTVICNYRFAREFTRGVTDGWNINKVNYFRLSSHLSASNTPQKRT